MDVGYVHKPDTVFCGHCGIAITDEPRQLKEYTHSQQGRCPFRGAAMSYAAWRMFESASTRVKTAEHRCKKMKRRQRKKDVELVAIQARLTAYEQFIDKIAECCPGQWWRLTPLEIVKRIHEAFGELKATEFCLECDFIVKSGRFKTTEANVKATKKRCKYA